MSVANFESDLAVTCDDLLALRAVIWRLSDHRWSDATGAGFESVYNSLLTGSSIPAGGAVTKDQANNAINAINSIRASIDNASSALATLAEFKPTV